MTLRAVGYTRVSTDDQAENGRSLEIQDLEIRKFCAERGIELVDVLVDEGVSASVEFDKRPAGSQAIDLLASRQATVLVAHRLDRLFRLGADALNTGTWFLRRGFGLLTVVERVDITTSAGWLSFGVQALVAEFERNKIVERGREISEGLREQGRVWGGTPFGCVRNGDLLFRDPQLWQVRERIVASRAAGQSYNAISEQLLRDRIPSPSGGRHWHISTLRGLTQGHAELGHIPFLPTAHEAAVSTQTH